MNPTVIVMVFIIYCFSSVSGCNPMVELNDTEVKTDDFNCILRIDKEMVECVNKTADGNKYSSDDHKLCCLCWTGFDCFKKFGKTKCSRSEYEVSFKIMEKLNQQYNDKCKDYPFGTKFCIGVNAISGVTDIGDAVDVYDITDSSTKGSAQTIFCCSSLFVFISFAFTLILK